jgi:hypothetical protein
MLIEYGIWIDSGHNFFGISMVPFLLPAQAPLSSLGLRSVTIRHFLRGEKLVECKTKDKVWFFLLAYSGFWPRNRLGQMDLAVNGEAIRSD